MKYQILIISFFIIVLSAEAQDTNSYGRSAASLIGTYLSDADSIRFDDFWMYDGGGFLLEDDGLYKGKVFAVGYWNSKDHTFRIFCRIVLVYGSRKNLVTDVLQLPKTELNGYHIVEQSCLTDKWDPEIIALVKDAKNNPEYFHIIKKAWRANRKTGKFEKIPARKVKKCGNESDGI